MSLDFLKHDSKISTCFRLQHFSRFILEFLINISNDDVTSQAFHHIQTLLISVQSSFDTPTSDFISKTILCMLHLFYDHTPHSIPSRTISRSLTFNTVRSPKFFTFSLMLVSAFELRSKLVSVFWFHQLSSSFYRSRSYRTSLSQSSESLRFHTFSGTTTTKTQQNPTINTIHTAPGKLTPNLAIAPLRIRDPGSRSPHGACWRRVLTQTVPHGVPQHTRSHSELNERAPRLPKSQQAAIR